METNNIKSFDKHLEERYGEKGTLKRTQFEAKAKVFAIGEMIKEERKQANLTQEQLAAKISAKKSYISRIENGKSDIQLSTLFKLFKFGLGRKINFTIL